jgi:mannose-6-phosphate isomerase
MKRSLNAISSISTSHDVGQKRVHTDLAAEALNFQVEDEYRTEYSAESNRADSVIDSPYFSVRVTEFSDTFHRNLIKYDSFVMR